MKQFYFVWFYISEIKLLPLFKVRYGQVCTNGVRFQVTPVVSGLSILLSR